MFKAVFAKNLHNSLRINVFYDSPAKFSQFGPIIRPKFHAARPREFENVYLFNSACQIRTFCVDRDRESTQTRQFFEGEAETGEPIGMKEYTRMCKTLNSCPSAGKLSQQFRKRLVFLPASSIRLEDERRFVDEVLTNWWNLYSKSLMTSSPQTMTSSNANASTHTATVLNSLSTLNKKTDGRVIELLGYEALQILTDSIFVGDFDVTFRTFAMTLRNLYGFLYNVSNSKVDSTKWSNEKLRLFVYKFYQAVESYYENSASASAATSDDSAPANSHANSRANSNTNSATGIVGDNAEENILFACYFANKFASNRPHNEKLMEIFVRIFQNISQNDSDHDIPSVQMIKLYRILEVLYAWQVNADDHVTQFWKGIFEKVEQRSHFLEQKVTPFTVLLLQHCALLAMRYDKEREFLVLRSYWTEVTWGQNLRLFRSTGKHEVVNRLHEKYPRETSKFTISGCMRNLCDVFEASLKKKQEDIVVSN